MATPPPLPTEAPATAPPPLAKSGGCLRGCLWGCLVVIILAVATPVVLVGVAYFVGRPYVAQHLPAWRASNPLLDAVVAYTEVDRYFQVGTAQPVDRGGRKPGQAGRGALPIDLPLAQDPIDEAVNANEGEVSVFQTVSAPPRGVAASWREGMAARGWKVARDEQDGENQVLLWTREDWRCRLDAGRPAHGPTEAWLRCGKTAAKAGKR